MKNVKNDIENFFSTNQKIAISYGLMFKETSVSKKIAYSPIISIGKSKLSLGFTQTDLGQINIKTDKNKYPNRVALFNKIKDIINQKKY